jgi:hypothetical protein
MALRPSVTQDAFSFSIETLAQALAPASGTITCAADAAAADGDIVTIGDGMNPAVVYEYDKSGNGVTAGRVAWAVGTTAASNATALAALIAANQPGISVSDNLAGVLTLTHKWPGVGGNVTITRSGNVTSAVTGMSGGSSGALAATATQKGTKLPRVFRVDSVQMNIPAGFAQDASNYWTIALKNGSTTVASWSTQTSGNGTVTAATPVTLTNSATDADLVFAAADIPSLVATKTGSPSSLPLVRLDVHGKFVS